MHAARRVAAMRTTAELVAALDELDDDGTRLPITRRWTLRMGAAAVVLMASLIGATWWLARPPAEPVEHEPVSLLIADFENHSGDTAFDHTVEPVLKLALEGAPFVSAYDRSGIRRSLGVVPPEVLNERTAMELAVKQGVGVVLAVGVPAAQRLLGRRQSDSGCHRPGDRECDREDRQPSGRPGRRHTPGDASA